MSAGLLLLGALSALATGGVLELDEVLASVDRFPASIVAAEERRIAAGESLAARGAFDPTLRARGVFDVAGYYRNQVFDVSIEAPTPLWGTTLIAGYRAGFGDFPSHDGKLATNAGGEVRAGVQIPLLRNGPIDRRRANIDRARVGERFAEEGVRLQRLDLERIAMTRYWEWVGAGFRWRIARDLLALAEARQAQLVARVAAGDLPDIERLENERALRQREAQVVAARRGVEQAAIELAVFLRDADGGSLPPTEERLPPRLREPELPLPLPDGVLLDSLRLRPERRRLSLLAQQLEIERKLAKNQLLPAVDLFGVVSRDLGGGDKVRAQTELELGVQIDLAILFRAARGRIAIAEGQLARTNAQLGLLERRIEAEIRDLHSALRAGKERLALVRREVELAAGLAKAELERFELGDSTLLLVNLREQAAAEAGVREVDALVELQRVQGQFRLAQGASLRD